MIVTVHTYQIKTTIKHVVNDIFAKKNYKFQKDQNSEKPCWCCWLDAHCSCRLVKDFGMRAENAAVRKYPALKEGHRLADPISKIETHQED